MKNTYLQANLVSMNRINVLLYTSINLPNNPKFILEKDGNNTSVLKNIRHISNNAISIFELEMNEDYEYGHNYVVILNGFIRFNVEVSEAVNFLKFDEQFYYDKDDLGSIYSKEQTSFSLWAPTASGVLLKIEEKDGFHLYQMDRTDKGVYRITLKGDLLNRKYHYVVTNSGVTVITNDPYGKGVSLNSEYSVVVDINELKKINQIKPTYKIKKNSDAIIYETSIRDFTEDVNTNIVNKGKYLGMVEEGKKTSGGHPAGIDHLKKLGITHVQILPVIDFFGNDDVDNSISYNWGYNPISFFALEGSYSSKPEIAMNRLIEFKTMVESFHKNNIRVVMDVVYNHVYEYLYSSFEKTVPNYFFRRKADGYIAVASGCGDDFASERLMARKAVIDSLKYFTEYFDIDGFRFDLMGLLDIETINEAYNVCKNIKEDILFYGEGWNMGYELPHDKKACSDNADKMPEIGFFNDLYRDVMKGGNFRDSITHKGFVGGNISQNNVVDYVIRGSCLDTPYPHRFSDYNQSLNYIECHDNNTLYDKLTFSNEDEDKETLLRRVRFANEVLALSFGMALIHMGQEIGQSKSGLDNTYNVLKINNMDWKLLDERYEMVEDLSKYISFRKYFHNNYKLYDKDNKPTVLLTQYWDNGVLAYYSNEKDSINNNEKVAVLVNPSNEAKPYELDDYYSVFFDLNKKLSISHTKNGILPPLSVQLLYVKGDKK